MSKFALLVIGASALTFLATGGYALLPRELYDPARNIKGNISINTGERIFHVPGQYDYEATVIRVRFGERWFVRSMTQGWRDGEKQPGERNRSAI